MDLRGNRLFSAAERAHAVMVLDLRNGKLIHSITGIAIPHAIYYRADLDRIYVTDGGDGDLKIFDGKNYALLKSVKLLPDSDAMTYDPSSKYLYIENGGGDAHQTYSMVSVVDTTSGDKLADVRVEGETLETMVVEPSSKRLYVNNRAKNQIEVVDRSTRAIVATWPITLGKMNVAIALDDAHHLLFVGCRSGNIVIFDTRTGKEVQALDIAKGVDDIVFDPASGRLYASCGDGAGAVNVYKETSANVFDSLGQAASGPGGRTSRLVPELHRYFVAVPAHEDKPAAILAYDVP